MSYTKKLMISGKIIAITKYVAINFVNISPHVMNSYINKLETQEKGREKPAQAKKFSVDDR